jgi:hypothetical protein
MGLWMKVVASGRALLSKATKEERYGIWDISRECSVLPIVMLVLESAEAAACCRIR